MAAIVGVDLGGTKCLAVAVVDGVVVAEDRVPTPADPARVVDTMAGVVDAVVAASGAPLAAIGVGVPGLVDRDGVLRFAPNLRGAHGMSIKAELEARFGVPVGADNDATCATWGEFSLGAARGLTNVIMVTLGTGIGGGIITGGRIHRGVNGFAGEVGHMVVDRHGPPCPCGRRGCWERYASGSGLGLMARLAALAGKADRVVALAGGDPESVKGEHVGMAIAEGDAGAAAIVDEFAFWLALGLANLANAFDPEAFIIGGGLVVMGDSLLEPAAASLQKQIIGRSVHPPMPILAATLGSRAGAIGAAFLAHEELRMRTRESRRRSVRRGRVKPAPGLPSPRGRLLSSLGAERMRIGITLPQFRHEAEPAFEVARRADRVGLDGVFVFDHLWPLGRPDRPALHSTTLLGALAAETERIVLATLVARVGLVPNAVLVHTLRTLDRMASGRFIAGLGTGDSANRAENEAYGVRFAPAAERLAMVCDASARLRAEGIRTWIGGLSAQVRRAAGRCADGWNGWGVSVDDFGGWAAELPPGVEATWAGQVLVGRTAADAAAKLERLGPRPGLVHGTVDDLAGHLQALQAAGATWAVCAPLDVGTDPEAIDRVAEAAGLRGRGTPSQ